MKRKKSIAITILTCTICVLLIIVSTCFNKQSKLNEKTIKVGVIDSYIPKETLDEKNIMNVNYTTNNGEPKNNHGMVILQLIQNECKNCEIYYASVLDEENASSIENVVSAINWCIDRNVDIICMSFSTSTDNESLRNVVQEAINNGIIITSSCINFSYIDCYPAMYENVISVSEGANKNATIIIKNKSFYVNEDGNMVEKRGTSVLNAYVCGYIAKELSKGNDDIKSIISDINEY